MYRDVELGWLDGFVDKIFDSVALLGAINPIVECWRSQTLFFVILPIVRWISLGNIPVHVKVHIYVFQGCIIKLACEIKTTGGQVLQVCISIIYVCRTISCKYVKALYLINWSRISIHFTNEHRFRKKSKGMGILWLCHYSGI